MQGGQARALSLPVICIILLVEQRGKDGGRVARNERIETRADTITPWPRYTRWRSLLDQRMIHSLALATRPTEDTLAGAPILARRLARRWGRGSLRDPLSSTALDHREWLGGRGGAQRLAISSGHRSPREVLRQDQRSASAPAIPPTLKYRFNRPKITSGGSTMMRMSAGDRAICSPMPSVSWLSECTNTTAIR
jgi:hypothetical protein